MAQATSIPPAFLITLKVHTANLEDPGICLKNNRINCSGSKLIKDLIMTTDCRPCVSFLHTFSLKIVVSVVKKVLFTDRGLS